MSIQSSDWQQTIKPVARNTHAELLKTHGQQTGALIEALEIARRRAEIEQTEKDWRRRHGFDLETARGSYTAHSYLSGGNLLVEAGNLLRTLAHEFGPQRAVHILTALEREQRRAGWGDDLRAWRAKMGYSIEGAATELGLDTETVTDIERGELCAGPDAMRLIRPALQRVRSEIQSKS